MIRKSGLTESLKKEYGYIIGIKPVCMRKWIMTNNDKKEIVIMPYIKNIEHEKVVNLAGEVEYMPGQVALHCLLLKKAKRLEHTIPKATQWLPYWTESENLR